MPAGLQVAPLKLRQRIRQRGPRHGQLTAYGLGLAAEPGALALQRGHAVRPPLPERLLPLCPVLGTFG
jgi:hypothetical protein